jgi:hypothetical protein
VLLLTEKRFRAPANALHGPPMDGEQLNPVNREIKA